MIDDPKELQGQPEDRVLEDGVVCLDDSDLIFCSDDELEPDPQYVGVK